MTRFSLCNRIFAVFLIPQRYILGIMGFLAVVNAYTMRVILSVAITEMVYPINQTNISYNEQICKIESESLNTPTVVSIFINGKL